MIVKRRRGFWEQARFALAGAGASPLLALLGLISGLLVGVIVILFRVIIDRAQALLLPHGLAEGYEGLAAGTRFLFPLIGGLGLGLLFFIVSRPPLRVGVVHVMERLAYHEGYLPAKNAVMQFIGGAVAIISGQSVGREGPSIHLGAAAASLMGQRLHLPNNSIRTLVACGVAAAIAASFNTPLAGVIFAMEVVMMEYTITGFTPVILASVSATTLNHAMFDTVPAFQVPDIRLASFLELPLLALMGIGIGILAAGFILSLNTVTAWGEKLPMWLRMTCAGIGVGGCALAVPEIMGVGYDTVDLALLGKITFAGTLLILLFKFAATILCLGMSIPGGLIGPVLFIGAMAGSATGLLVQIWLPLETTAGLYAVVGMAAMMGATLQAPLAALLAVVELTGHIGIVFPGMLAIISATLASRELFGQDSVYVTQMRHMGLDYRNDPVSQSLRRLAVISILDDSFVQVATRITREQAQNLLAENTPRWLVVEREAGHLLMPAADLARYLEENPETEEIPLMEIPGRRRQLVRVTGQDTLQQALNRLEETGAEAVYATGYLGLSGERIIGVALRREITEGYHP